MFHSISLIFIGAALLATLALFARQSLLVAYIVLGMLIGPFGLHWVSDSTLIHQTGEVGIIFLLFLLGLHLQPHNLIHSLRSSSLVVIVSTLLFAGLGMAVGYLCGFTLVESCIIGATMVFSSTLIGLKLLPTTVLHHQRMGEIIVSILLLQDLIAISLLVLLNGSQDGISATEITSIVVGLPCLVLVAFAFERFILTKLLLKFDGVKEFIFLLSIGWCLGLAQLTYALGLSLECGAFIAGVVLAEGPIALYIAESLKPLRDFFLIMFFFAIGASFDLYSLPTILLPAVLLAGISLLAKPWIFAYLLKRAGESHPIAIEVGVRLGQGSEFSLLVAYLSTYGLALISDTTSSLIQATTILTFIASSYFVVWRYPTPISLSPELRRD